MTHFLRGLAMFCTAFGGLCAAGQDWRTATCFQVAAVIALWAVLTMEDMGWT